MAFDWAGLASLIATGYGINRANRDPEFFQAPPDPTQQWAFDRRKELYANDPVRNYMLEYSKQFMDGMQLNPQGFTVRDGRGGQGAQFMGGMRFPTFDTSRFGNMNPPPQAPSGTEPTPQPKPSPTGPALPPGAQGNDPFRGFPTNNNSGQNYTWEDVKRIAEGLGSGASELLRSGSLIGMGINGAISFLRSRFGGQQTLPTNNTQRPIDALKPSGYEPPNGAGIYEQSKYQQWLDAQRAAQAERDRRAQEGYDKMSGAQTIGKLLSTQEGEGGRAESPTRMPIRRRRAI